MVTRRIYEALAEAIRNAEILGGVPISNFTDAPPVAVDKVSLVSHIADVLARDNPRFDRARFYTACNREPISDSLWRYFEKIGAR